LIEYPDIYKWQPPDSGCAITLGRFDGIHLGHRALLERAVEHARHHDLVPVCFSFQEKTCPWVLKNGQLTTEEEKAEILDQIGIEVLLHPAFAPPLIDMTADDFFHSLVVERWNAKLIVVGYDFHFGRKRGGTPGLLISEGDMHDIEVEIFKPFMVGDVIVKATAIRKMISSGDIENCTKLLGRHYSVNVTPQKGRGLGRDIGFPTINFAWPGLKVKPLPGIYAVTIKSSVFNAAQSDSVTLNGVANFGFQPTIEPDNKTPVLEVHILDELPAHLDTPGSIPPDTHFNVEFVAFLRKEEKFGSIEELKSQITSDCRMAKAILSKMGF